MPGPGPRHPGLGTADRSCPGRLSTAHPGDILRSCGHLNPRTVLNAKRPAYFLLLLLISAQLDDAWAAALASPSAPIAEDNDEYLPAQRRPQEEETALGQEL